MKLTYKLQKLVSGEAVNSALRRAREAYPRRPLALDAARIARTVPAEKFRALRQKHAVADPGDHWPKYLDLERWMEINLRRVREVGLDLGGRKRVLDLGCGAGYFLYICRYFGHEVLGLDVDDTLGFAEMIALLTVPRVIWRIEPFVRLPQLGGRFDLITAHMICFNGHKSERLWGVPEWEFFLDDLAQHLEPGGMLSLELNREYDGSLYQPELKAYFEARGADLHTQRVLFRPLHRVPTAGARAVARWRERLFPRLTGRAV